MDQSKRNTCHVRSLNNQACQRVIYMLCLSVGRYVCLSEMNECKWKNQHSRRRHLYDTDLFALLHHLFALVQACMFFHPHSMAASNSFIQKRNINQIIIQILYHISGSSTFLTLKSDISYQKSILLFPAQEEVSDNDEANPNPTFMFTRNIFLFISILCFTHSSHAS